VHRSSRDHVDSCSEGRAITCHAADNAKGICALPVDSASPAATPKARRSSGTSSTRNQRIPYRHHHLTPLEPNCRSSSRSFWNSDRAKRADYILYFKPNIPLAVIEAKDNW